MPDVKCYLNNGFSFFHDLNRRSRDKPAAEEGVGEEEGVGAEEVEM